LPTIGGGVLSIAWLAVCITVIEQQLLWSDLLLLLPHELGGMAAGVFTPLALLWMVIAFFEGGRRLRHETESLRWHLKRLAYPSGGARTRMDEITSPCAARPRS
jgi:hypothetical protein